MLREGQGNRAEKARSGTVPRRALFNLDERSPNQICARPGWGSATYREREEEVQGTEKTGGDLADRKGCHFWRFVEVR